MRLVDTLPTHCAFLASLFVLPVARYALLSAPRSRPAGSGVRMVWCCCSRLECECECDRQAAWL